MSARVTIKGVSYPVTSIGKRAFFHSAFTGFSLPNTITSIGAYAFANYFLQGAMVIPDSVTDIAEYAFYEASFAGGLTLGNGVKTIGRYAFFNASNVGSLVIPNSATTIGEGAFFDADVTSLTLGNSVTTIGERAFMYTNVPTAPNPTISGTATVGQILTAVTTGWVPNVGVSFTYEWKRADTAGGVGTTVGSLDKYTLAPGDRGKFITVTVTATKTGYITTSRTSLPTSAVG